MHVVYANNVLVFNLYTCSTFLNTEFFLVDEKILYNKSIAHHSLSGQDSIYLFIRSRNVNIAWTPKYPDYVNLRSNCLERLLNKSWNDPENACGKTPTDIFSESLVLFLDILTVIGKSSRNSYFRITLTCIITTKIANFFIHPFCY